MSIYLSVRKEVKFPLLVCESVEFLVMGVLMAGIAIAAND